MVIIKVAQTKASTVFTSNLLFKLYEGVIRGFHEKVIRPPTNEANAAIYVFDKRLKKFLLSECPEAQDFSREVLPLLVNRMQASRLSGRVIDIGTPERLAQANMQEWG